MVRGGMCVGNDFNVSTHGHRRYHGHRSTNDLPTRIPATTPHPLPRLRPPQPVAHRQARS
jgi:hypothetical protein